MVEDVAGIPAGLDLLESRVVVLVVQRVPGNPGGVPFRIGEVDIGMVDHGAVADLAGHGHAAGVGEQVPVERANPRQGPGFVLRVLPAGRTRRCQNRVPLRRGRRVRRHGVDLSSVGCETQHPTRNIVIGPGQVVVGDVDLAIRESLAQESVLDLEERVLRARLEQLGEGIEGKGQPGAFSRRRGCGARRRHR